MKTQEQIQRRIKRLENRINHLEEMYKTKMPEFIFNQIEQCEKDINLLNWVLGNEEY